MSEPVVTDNVELQRFEARLDGALAGFAEYQLADELMVFTHTEVDPSFEGRGVGSALAKFALDKLRVDGTRKALPLFLWSAETGGPVTRYALPISGKGLWSTIYGYLALDGRAETVLGATFYRHAETPGLGGEVEKEWFQKNFAGLTAWRNGVWRRIEVAKGTVGGQRHTAETEQVDGISGATLTGNGINKFLNADLRRYAPYFDALRGKEGAADGR